MQRRFRIMYHTEPPTDKIIREWYMNSSRVAACALWNEQAVRAYGPLLLHLVCCLYYLYQWCTVNTKHQIKMICICTQGHGLMYHNSKHTILSSKQEPKIWQLCQTSRSYWINLMYTWYIDKREFFLQWTVIKLWIFEARRLWNMKLCLMISSWIWFYFFYLYFCISYL